MNNLSLVQEARLGIPQIDTIPLDFGRTFAVVVPPQLGWPSYGVRLDDDPLLYEFPNFASAFDFVCDEARLADGLH